MLNDAKPTLNRDHAGLAWHGKRPKAGNGGKNGKPNGKEPQAGQGQKWPPKMDFRGSFPCFSIFGPSFGRFCPCPDGSGVAPANQTKERAKTKSSYEFRPFLCEFWCFSLGKRARFTLNFCSGMPLGKVHKLTFLWFGLPGPLLNGGSFPLISDHWMVFYFALHFLLLAVFHATPARHDPNAKLKTLNFTPDIPQSEIAATNFYDRAKFWAKNWAKFWANFWTKFSGHFRASCAVQNDPPKFLPKFLLIYHSMSCQGSCGGNLRISSPRASGAWDTQ